MSATLTEYLLVGAFVLLALNNAVLAYQLRGTRGRMVLAGITAAVLGFLAWRSWPA